MSVFQKYSKLLSQKDFSRVFESKKLKRYDVFTIFYRQNSLGYPRIGLAVSKKNVATAVCRNKIKRIVRESFRHSTIMANDYVVVVSYKIKYHNKKEFRSRLDYAWLKFEN